MLNSFIVAQQQVKVSKDNFLRGATSIANYPSDAFAYLAATGATEVAGVAIAPITVLDTPATTSATTYVVHGAASNNTAEVFFQRDSTMSTITLMEVSA